MAVFQEEIDPLAPQREAALFYGLFLRGHSAETLRKDIDVPPKVLAKMMKRHRNEMQIREKFHRVYHFRKQVLAIFDELVDRERTGKRIEILAPQRGEKRSLVDLVCQNAKQSYDQRFRVLQPGMKAIQEALQDALILEDLPRRIECFDISHIQGAETVASMVVWEDGAMKKSDYRKFQVKTVTGVDDFASMREVIHRRYKRLQEEKKAFPSLILIDGGLGQLHAAYSALEEIGITLQPLASIAKREEIIYVYGQENEPVVLDRRSPVLHLMQKIRDESHRFAVTYHRKRRQMRDRESELLSIPGVGPRTRQRLIEHFGSVRGIKQAAPDALTAVVNAATAEKIRSYFDAEATSTAVLPILR